MSKIRDSRIASPETYLLGFLMDIFCVHMVILLYTSVSLYPLAIRTLVVGTKVHPI